MIVYLDTSAFVPLLISEPASAACRRIWNDADTVVSSRLLYVETAAALAMARRLDRVIEAQHGDSLRLLDELWGQLDVAEVDEALAYRAAALSRMFPLRGYDAVHCASAEQLVDADDDLDDVVAAAGDRRLLAAWTELGLATFDTNA